MEEVIEIKDGKREILSISCDEESGTYTFRSPAGCNAAEIAFSISALIRALERDLDIPRKEFIEKIETYLNDTQYDELIEEGVN